MEKHPLCFLIEGKQLYLDYVLIDYEHIPLFFICKAEETYYLVLCTDIDELSYFVVKVPINDLHEMLHDKKAMRDCILKQSGFWRIISGSEPSGDTVEYCSMNTIDLDVLPEEHAVYEAITKQDQDYLETFDLNLFSKDYKKYVYKKSKLTYLIINNNSISKDIGSYTNYRNNKVSYSHNRGVNGLKQIMFSLPEDIGVGVSPIEIDGKNDLVFA